MSTRLIDGKSSYTVNNGLVPRAPPQYSITRGKDHALQWEPPIGSRELANALSYHYPMENGLQEMMQRAILDFFELENPLGTQTSKEAETGLGRRPSSKTLALAMRTEKGVTDAPKQQESHILPSQTTQGPEMCVVWDVRTGEPVKRKGRSGRLSPETAKKVAENRGNTCERHQKAKTRVSHDTMFSSKRPIS
jgi:hypothetical protein